MQSFPKSTIAIIFGVLVVGIVVYFCATAANPNANPTPTPAQSRPAGNTQAPPAQSTATPVPPAEATPTDEPTAGAGTNMVVASDQAIGAGNVLVVGRVTAAADGWIVIHADEGGNPGAVVGYAAVKAGENDGIQVSVTDPAALTPTLWAMLHVDAGTVGTYEFPGADGPVKDDGGAVVMVSFKLL